MLREIREHDDFIAMLKRYSYYYEKHKAGAYCSSTASFLLDEAAGRLENMQKSVDALQYSLYKVRNHYFFLLGMENNIEVAELVEALRRFAGHIEYVGSERICSDTVAFLLDEAAARLDDLQNKRDSWRAELYRARLRYA